MQNHSHTHFNELTQQTVRRLALSLGITLAFVAVEIFAGIFANSLALLTDAAHNFTDVMALALSWWALRLTSQPADQGKTYGYHRAGILAALANSTTLVVIALGIFYEAYQRFINPPEVQADVLMEDSRKFQIFHEPSKKLHANLTFLLLFYPSLTDL